MSELIKIAVDAMGGDGSPEKIIKGIIHNHNSNKENFFKIFGNEKEIQKYLNNQIDTKFFEIIPTDNIVKSTDSPLEGAKRGKNTSMWLSIESVKKKEADIVVSANVISEKLKKRVVPNINFNKYFFINLLY
jgi:glycerol-3-phosphate acyltransferase PlsX